MKRRYAFSSSVWNSLASIVGVATLVAIRYNVHESALPHALLFVSPLSSLIIFQMLCRAATKSNGSQQVLSSRTLFLLGFVFVFIVRQLFVNDAFAATDSLVREDGNLEGAPLGTPNLTGIAIGIIGGIGMAMIGKVVSRKKLLTKRGALSVSMRVFVYGVIVWAIFAGIYQLNLSLHIVEDGAPFISKAFFMYAFTGHAEYAFLVPFVAAVYSFAILHSVAAGQREETHLNSVSHGIPL